jgi:hypothetical protein
MRAFDASWRVLAGAGLLATVAVTGCSAGSTSAAGAGGGQPASQPATATATSAGQSAAATPSASPSASAGIENLVVTSAVRSELAAAYVAMRQIPAADVSGTQPNSVYYAYDQATSTYWAMADFVATQTDPQNVLVNFQDGGSEGLYKKVGAGPWQVQQGGDPGICVDLRFFPRAVLKAWAINTTLPAGLNC